MNRVLDCIGWLGLLLTFAAVLCFGGCTGYLHPVTPEVLSQLSPADANTLRCQAAAHPEVPWDLRFHSIYTCPFLSYTPAYAIYAAGGDTQWWAHYLVTYFHHVCLEKGGCDACGPKRERSLRTAMLRPWFSFCEAKKEN